MGEKGAVINKQKLSEEFLNGFHVCEETPKVEQTAVYLETDVDAVWQGLFCLMEHDAEKDGEQCGSQDASLLDAVGYGVAVRQKSIVLHLTLLTFMELAENGKKLGGGGAANVCQDFHSPSQLTVSKAMVSSMNPGQRKLLCSALVVLKRPSK